MPQEQIEERRAHFERFGAWELIKEVHQRDPIHPNYEVDFDRLANYWWNAGSSFRTWHLETNTLKEKKWITEIEEIKYEQSIFRQV
ncbi:hypothetical protein A7K91_11170 [Paenibacillus oryzae]|uniref:Uncharacterized protein n=1 Tax=Paenibacillus oryzae TaxID=1844972 RepID=A0A1A5YED9_9BACL|nr:hypothetical protein A7K91_11170 [Paenibacillus oryzae]